MEDLIRKHVSVLLNPGNNNDRGVAAFLVGATSWDAREVEVADVTFHVSVDGPMEVDYCPHWALLDLQRKMPELATKATDVWTRRFANGREPATGIQPDRIPELGSQLRLEPRITCI